MDPAVNWRPTKDPAQRQEAERYVITATNLLLEGKIERCWHLLIEALDINPCAPRGNALRATDLPGPPIPTPSWALTPPSQPPVTPPSSNLTIAKRPTCSTTARLVANAWAFLSDPVRKAAFDSRFEAFEAAVAAADPILAAPLQPAPLVEEAPPPLMPSTPPHPAPPPPALPDDMGRGKRSKKLVPPAQAAPDDMGRGKRPPKPVKRMNL